MRVLKFGGSSLANRERCAEAAMIVQTSAGEKKAVVVSAPGTSGQYQEKMTGTLIRIAALLVADKTTAWRLWSYVQRRFVKLVKELDVDIDLEPMFRSVERRLRSGVVSEAYLASRGEWIMGWIMAAYLDAEYVEAADVIRFRGDGSLDEEESYRLVQARCSELGLFVIPGYYGATDDGSIHTLGRGGSDVTMAIVARALNAERAEKWTDVEGVADAPPKIVPVAETIPRVTYVEMRELAAGGASVLHPDVMIHVRPSLERRAIPVFIRNTRAPEAVGTEIVSDRLVSESAYLAGIAVRDVFVTIRITDLGMNDERGYGAQVLDALRDRGLSFDHLVTGADSMAVTFHSDALASEARVTEIAGQLRALLPKACIECEDALSIVAVVGHHIRTVLEVPMRITTALTRAGICQRMLSHGASHFATIVAVSAAEGEEAVAALHREFFPERYQMDTLPADIAAAE